MEYINLQKDIEFQRQTIENSMNSAYFKVLRIGNRFLSNKIGKKFTINKRIKMLNQMLEYFERHEEYEKCKVISNILKNYNTNK